MDDPMLASYISRLWEWGMLVGFLGLVVLIEFLVIKSLYHRNTSLSDSMMQVMIDTKEVLTEIKDVLRAATAPANKDGGPHAN